MKKIIGMLFLGIGFSSIAQVSEKRIDRFNPLDKALIGASAYQKKPLKLFDTFEFKSVYQIDLEKESLKLSNTRIK